MTVPFPAVQPKHDDSAGMPADQQEWIWIIEFAKQTVMQIRSWDGGLNACFAMLFKQLWAVQLQHSCTTFGSHLALRFAPKACLGGSKSAVHAQHKATGFTLAL